MLGAWVIALLGGVAAAALSDAEPTGLDTVDALYRGIYVVAVSVSCAHARRWTWPVLAGTAAVAALDRTPLILGGAALVVAALAQLDRRRRQPVGAAVGTLAALALLDLAPFIAFGAPSVVATLAPLPALASSLAASRRRTRRRLLIGAASTGAAGMAVVLGAGVGMLLLRGDAAQGVEAARTGLDALRNGSQTQAADSFATAASAFDDAHAMADAWWMAPARAVPVLGQHLAVARSLTDEGADLARVSARTAPAVSLDDLTTPTGVFRLDHITELEPLAREVLGALRGTSASLEKLSTDWLAEPLVAAVEDLDEEVASSLAHAELAAEAIAVAPRLLGVDEPRRYVVLFANPAEAREMGGFVASVGMLDADRGALTFTSLPDMGALRDDLARSGAELDVDVPAPFVSANPARYVQNWTDSADIATVTAVVDDLLGELPESQRVDGVLYVDPYVLATVLELTGPVTVPGTDEVLDATNAAEFLLRGQYQSSFLDARGERKEHLGDAGEIAFRRLLSGAIPPPRQLAESFSPLVAARRLLFSSTDATAHALLERVGLRPPLDQGGGDTLLVAHSNRRPNKLDAFLRRSIDHHVEVSEDARMTATVTVELTNEAPQHGLVPYQTGEPRPGDPGPEPTNHVSLEILSGLDETEVLVDGATAAYSDSPAYGLNQYTIPVSVPAGATVVVEVHLQGRVDLRDCAVTVLPNASASQDALSITMVHPAGAEELPSDVLDEPVTVPCG